MIAEDKREAIVCPDTHFKLGEDAHRGELSHEPDCPWSAFNSFSRDRQILTYKGFISLTYFR
jgi:hypothetical protein